MELFRGIHEAVRDKAADELCAHLRALGIPTELLHGHPLQKVGEKTLRGWMEGGGKSLGLVQVTGRNIGYVNVIQGARGGTSHSPPETVYYLDYLVPLGEIPLGICHAALETRKRWILWGEVLDIKWVGGSLASTLNDDLALKQSLLIEFRLHRPLGIEIAPEPVYQCARISTRGVTKHHGLLRPQYLLRSGGAVLHLPSGSLFDCLDRIAGHIAPHVTEVNSRPEEVLLKAKVEVNPRSKDAEVADCYVTVRHVLLESREPLKIPLYQVDDCHVSTTIPTEGAAMANYSRMASSVVTLRYCDASGHRRTVEFAMSTFDAGALYNTVIHSYPCGISR